MKMQYWESFSGTGEQQQESALRRNLDTIKQNLEETLSWVDLVKSEESIRIIEKARELMNEIDLYSSKHEENDPPENEKQSE